MQIRLIDILLPDILPNMSDLSASQAKFMHTDFIALKLISNEVNLGSSINLKNESLIFH